MPGCLRSARPHGIARYQLQTTGADIFSGVKIAEDADRNGSCEPYRILRYLIRLFWLKAVIYGMRFHAIFLLKLQLTFQHATKTWHLHEKQPQGNGLETEARRKKYRQSHRTTQRQTPCDCPQSQAEQPPSITKLMVQARDAHVH